MMSNYEDAMQLDGKHLLSLAPVVVLCLLGGILVQVGTDNTVVWWQAFAIIAFLLIGFVCTYRGLHSLLAQRLVGEQPIWHQNSDIINGLLWFNVAAALLVTWIFITILPALLSVLLMAGFCLGALLSLGRNIILVAPPFPKDF